MQMTGRCSHSIRFPVLRDLNELSKGQSLLSATRVCLEPELNSQEAETTQLNYHGIERASVGLDCWGKYYVQ